jgi:nitrous oxidase accessory protein NosD
MAAWRHFKADAVRQRLWPAWIFVVGFLFAGSLAAAQLRVPRDYATIQGAIDAAIDGEMVLVAPGTYHELLDFHGKAITVRSVAGPSRTIIDGDGAGTVVTFISAETRESVLEGFTVRGGYTVFRGGGIFIAGLGTSPTVRGNWIVENQAGLGAGIFIGFGDPLIEANLIARNTGIGWGPGGGGGGIAVGNGYFAVIVGNRIEDNSTGLFTFGAGIRVESAYPVVADNVIRGNHTDGDGGGIAMPRRSSSALVIQNLVVGNSARRGGGLYFNGGASQFLSNTFSDNSADEGEVAYMDWYWHESVFEDNLFIAHGPGVAIACGSHQTVLPSMAFNDLYSPRGPLVNGACASPIGQNGNISVDPLFAPSGDYRLRPGSPAVDAGNPNPLAALDRDLAGRRRVSDGDHDGAAVLDLGAYELPGSGH